MVKIEKHGQKKYFFLIALLVYAYWKARLGVHPDEMHTIAVGDMISRGNTFLKRLGFTFKCQRYLMPR